MFDAVNLISSRKKNPVYHIESHIYNYTGHQSKLLMGEYET